MTPPVVAGMENVAIEDVNSWFSPATAKRVLSRALGTEHLAINHYELAPGETFGFGYHRHSDQEEVFYVLAGTVTFETEDGEVTVGDGEVVRFAPGEWQLGRNAGDEPVEALALGAPQDSAETDVRRECDSCGGRQPTSIEPAEDADAVVTICKNCGAETGRYTR